MLHVRAVVPLCTAAQLDKILALASAEVDAWPAWKRSPDIRAELQQLEKETYMSLKLLPLRDKLWAHIKESPYLDESYDVEGTRQIFHTVCDMLDFPSEVSVSLLEGPVGLVTVSKDGVVLPTNYQSTSDSVLETYVINNERFERSLVDDTWRYAVAARTWRMFVPQDQTSPVTLAKSLVASIQEELAADLALLTKHPTFKMLVYCPYWPPLLSGGELLKQTGDRWWMLRYAKLAWFEDGSALPLGSPSSDAVFLASLPDGTYEKVWQRYKGDTLGLSSMWSLSALSGRDPSKSEDLVFRKIIGRYRKAKPDETSQLKMLDPADHSLVDLVAV